MDPIACAAVCWPSGVNALRLGLPAARNPRHTSCLGIGSKGRIEMDEPRAARRYLRLLTWVCGMVADMTHSGAAG